MRRGLASPRTHTALPPPPTPRSPRYMYVWMTTWQTFRRYSRLIGLPLLRFCSCKSDRELFAGPGGHTPKTNNQHELARILELGRHVYVLPGGLLYRQRTIHWQTVFTRFRWGTTFDRWMVTRQVAGYWKR
jgi:hypothetical protein